MKEQAAWNDVIYVIVQISKDAVGVKSHVAELGFYRLYDSAFFPLQ